MNDRPDDGPIDREQQFVDGAATTAGMHDISSNSRSVIMGGSSAGGQTAIVTTTSEATVTGSIEAAAGAPLNGLTATVLETNSGGGSSSSNGVHNNNHHHHPPSSAYMNNNNCVKRVVQGQVIKCNNINSSSSSSNSLVPNDVQQSHVPQVTMSDGGDRRPLPLSLTEVNNRPVAAAAAAATNTTTVTVSSSSSSAASSSSTSSRSSSLSTSPMPMLIRGLEEEEEQLAARQQLVDERKVEPLKINLHREPIRTVIKLGGQSPEVSMVQQHHHHVQGVAPKITIKPIPNPMPVVSSTNELVGGAENDRPVVGTTVTAGNTTSHHEVSGGGIPKLHIRMNHAAADSGTESQSIVPKLTIRNATTNAAAVATNCNPLLLSPGGMSATPGEGPVPKLTIKMDHQHHQHNVSTSPQVPRLTIKTNSLGGHAIGSGGSGEGSPSEHLTVPKLTIKVPSDQTSSSGGGLGGIVGRSVSPGSGLISSSTHSGSCATMTATDGGAIPKLTLKNISRTVQQQQQSAHQQQQSLDRSEEAAFQIVNAATAIPKLKVKLQPRCPVQPEADYEEEEELSSERSYSDAEDAKIAPLRIPKLTIKPPKTDSTNQQQQVNEAVSGEIQKLVIKPIPKPENSGDPDGETTTTTAHVANHIHHSRLTSADVQPLEVSTSALGHGGPQSPRIILKINRTQNSIVSNSTEANESVASSEQREENLLKRHLQQQQSELVSSTPKRSKAEERIIAVIDLDEDSGPAQEMRDKNGRVEEEAHSIGDAKVSKRVAESQTIPLKVEDGVVANNNCTQRNVPEEHHHRVLRRGGGDELPGAGKEEDERMGSVDEEDGEERDPLAGESEDRLQATTEPVEGIDEMQTPVVKRGRGRPRKTPIVVRDFQDSSSDIVPESNKKRGRKKKEEEAAVEIQVPALVEATVSETESLPSPAFTSAKKPRGGRGGGAARTPSSRGGSAKRGRGGAMRKPFNKARYFKQKTFEESITSACFEEDTRMSAADSSMSMPKTLIGSQNDAQDSVSQSSHLSSTSVTMDSTQTSSMPEKRKKLKMEVVGTIEGKTEFTVDMLAEYDWPLGVGCLRHKKQDTYMIQEQIAEYLGVKSFKRKYPDLERRTVEMEERNHLIEKGLVTEKMCDLGVTAVYAVDVLDIMYQDFHDKYELYKQHHREKLAKDLTMRQKLNKGEYGLGAREKAMRSVSKWNATLNRTRKEERRIHMDLQNFTIQVPEGKRKNMTIPTPKPSIYPVALVVGQFSEHYRTYTPSELLCYPINTALTNPDDLMKRLLEAKVEKQQRDDAAVMVAETVDVEKPTTERGEAEEQAEEEERTAKSSSGSSSSDESNDSDGDDTMDSTSSESECDVNDDDLCCVCTKSQFTSPNDVPELFVKCAVCMKMAHPSCISMSSEMAKRAFQYLWQCVDCKKCQGCQKTEDQQRMLYCQQCDRAYHIYCTRNSLQAVPSAAWHCDICSICRRCGCRNPDGTNNRIPSKQVLGGGRPEWKHQYVVNGATRLKEHCGMLCVRCSILATTSGVS